MSTNKTNRSLVLLPLGVGALFAILSLLGATKGLEFRAYDFFLGLKPEVKQDKSIVLLDVDEESVVRTGSWPWPRGLIAKGLEGLSEFGSSYAVFDIEYIEKSPMSVDREYLEGGLKNVFDGFFDDIGSNIGDLFSAIGSGNIKLADARDYGEQLLDYLKTGKGTLYAKTGKVAVENDSYLGRAMRLFGNSFVTINLQPAKLDAASAAQRAIAESSFAYPKVTAAAPVRSSDKDFLLPILEVSSMARSAGFTNVFIDEDGVRRRIRLVEEIDGKRYLQLAFSPLMRRLGEPEVMVKNSSILLKGARLADRSMDISIPLDEEGRMLIRWPRANYAESFTHLSFYRILEYLRNEGILVSNLRYLAKLQAWSLVPSANPIDAAVAAWDAESETRDAAIASGSAEDRATWLAAKAAAKAETATVLAAGWDTRLPEIIDVAKAKAKAADTPLYDELKTRVATLFGNCINTQAIVDEQGKKLRSKLEGAFCIIGWTATATTDIGVNPFHKSYVNVGTHAAVANTIIQRDFIYPAPTWVSALASLILAALVAFAISRLETATRIVAGVVATIIVIALDYALFALTGIYVQVLAPALSTFVSFLGYAGLSFLISEREKNFIRKAFGTYLSGDIINQIIADPDKLSLGGQKMWITAQFTDVKGFSTISEALDPEQLVKLLNLYLTGMSNIILAQRGTIDKFEGDAIISFFGAPVHYETHARESVLSAILMKKKEAEMNMQFLADKLSPTPLLTRIGLNTGDIVVGNMGTEKKMNYTIMGNAVNLAARLEGVNKQYGTWILASGATKEEAGDEFVSRRLDQVRVVGINTPVQLWEMIDQRSETKEENLDFLSRFEQAHLLFDARDWKASLEAFATLAVERPGDGPSATYLRRSETFVKTPQPADWDGVFSLSEK
ncbi:MAG: adenylate/guanylate cyclase domain-containing protein [Spirochaetota bacterium]